MTLNQWLYLSPFIMFYGFQWYAGAIKAWPTMHILPRTLTAIMFLFFIGFDVLWNVIVGSIIYLELPFRNKTFTFSQRTEYWYNKPLSWRCTYILGANNWAAFLDSIVAGHIKKIL